MHRLLRLTVFVGLSLSPWDVSAQALNFSTVLDKVKAQSLTLRATAEQFEAARFVERSRQGAFDFLLRSRYDQQSFGIYDHHIVDVLLEQPLGPWSASIYGGYTNAMGKFAIYEGKLETGEGGQLRTGAKFSLWRDRDLDNRRYQLQSSTLGAALAAADLDLARLKAIQQASKQYWSLLLSYRRLSIAQELLTIAESRQRFLGERTRLGDIPQFDFDDNQRVILQRQAQVLSAQRAFQAECNELSVLIQEPIDETTGLAKDELLPSASEFEAYAGQSFLDWVNGALERHPEIRSLEVQKRTVGLAAKFWDQRLAPTLDVALGLKRELGEADIPISNQQFESMVMFELPLQRREAKGARASALAQKRRLEHREALLRSEFEYQAKDLLQDLGVIRQRFRLASEELKLARMLEEGERRRFLQGESNLIFVNVREQATFDTLMRYYEAAADFRRREADLHALLAKHL